VPIDIIWAFYQISALDINGMDSGSAIPSTSREQFYRLPVALPPIAVLRVFTAAVEPLYRKRDENDAECETLATIRDTLLPKLLSGEVRIREAEKVVEAHV
jgi:type I restriction enzyme S subunit